MTSLSHRTTYLKFTADRGILGPEVSMFEPLGPDITPLSRDLPRITLTLSQALNAGAGTRSAPLTRVHLAQIARWTLGLQRYEATDAYPLHRAVPAPRCKHTTELHYVSFGAPGQPATLSRYDPRHHQLSRTTSPELVTAAGRLQQADPEARDGWLISGAPQRLRSLYGDFAARLMMLEAGHVLGQVQMLSAVLGYGTRAVTLVPAERLWPPMVDEVPVAGVLNVAGTIHPSLASAPPALNRSLEACMTQRQSGHGVNGVYPQPGTLSQTELLALAWHAVPAHMTGRVQVHALVQHITGLEPGVYTFHAPDAPPVQRCAVRLTSELQNAIFTNPGFQVRYCPVVFLLSVDLAAEPASFTDTHLAAGQVAQRLSLCAAAHGLFARPALSHQEAELDALLGFTQTTDSVLYTLLIGRDRDAGFPVRLSL